jgi:hypothetical protein
MDVSTYPPKLTAWSADGKSSITVEGLDNPNYPYHDLKWWDRWIWENRAQALGDAAKESVAYGGGSFVQVFVDQHGYAMPLLEMTLASYGNLQMTIGDYLDRKPAPYSSPPYHFWMMMEDKMFDALLDETGRVKCQHYPAVPKWLIDLPTMQRAIALPDGRWIVVVYQDEMPNACSVMQYGKYENYLLYSKTGELLEPPHKRQSSLWLDVLWDCAKTTSEGPYAQSRVEKDIPIGVMSNTQGLPGGYTALTDMDTGSLLALYDYDGTPLFERGKLGNETAVRKINVGKRFMYCVDIDHGTWQRVYEAQNN